MPVFCSSCGGPNNDEARFCSSCGSQITKVSITLTKETVLDGRYKIIELIKAGGMGAVYKAVDNRLDELCAVKEMFSNYTTQEDQDYAEKRFYQEAKTLAKLRHINLPRVIDHFKHQGKFYLVMDFIEGEDLEAILKREGKGGLPEKRIVEYSIQILDVLTYLHNQPSPIVYRDLKPPNIMIQRGDGKIMLIDFGIARTVQPGSVTKKTSVGTEGYIAPEQYVGKPEPRSDIYSLGATMHHLLTGMEPMIPFHFTPANKINPLISERLNDFVMKALQMKPEDRFSTAEEMKKILMETQIPATQAGYSNGLPIGASPRITVVAQTEPVYRTLPKPEEPVYRTLPKSEEPVYRTLPKPEEPVYRTLPKSEEPVYRTLPPKSQSEEHAYRTLPPKPQEGPEGMILIPEGEFIVGSDGGDASCRPQQKVYLPAFYIDKYPVSHLMYRKFVRETNHKIPFMEEKEFKEYCWTKEKNYPPGKANQPVVLVSWYDAYAYAKWAGKRLPWELEWEKAARGTDGRMYPWGDKWEIGKANCLTGGIGSTSPREMFPMDKSIYGVMEMAGNVKEWTGDYFYPYPYKGPYKKGKMITIRGGSWSENPNFLTVYLRSRNLPHFKYNNLGFRCAMNVNNEQ